MGGSAAGILTNSATGRHELNVIVSHIATPLEAACRPTAEPRMSTVPSVRQCVQDAKGRLAEQRRKAKRQHEIGLPAADICDRLADTLDVIVLDIFEAALADLSEKDARRLMRGVALVPHAGYGRRDVAPYSDLDLMLLYAPQVRDLVDPLAKRLLVDIFDAGLSFGHAVRTTAEACQLAWSDATIYSSLVESRYLAGSVSLYTRFEIGRAHV